jgi:hypothetical protein
MKKLIAIVACALLASSPLSAALLRVQTVISRFADDGKTDLLGAPSVILHSERPARASIESVDLIMLGSGNLESGLRLNARLLKKIGDGKIQRIEVPTTTLEAGKPVIVRAGEFQLEFTASLEELAGMNVEFPGGTLSELLASLPKNKPATFNVIGEKEDMATQLPPISLYVVTPDVLFAALNKILNPRGLAISQSRAGNYDQFGRGMVYVLERIVRPEAGLSPTAPRFRSYPLHDYLTETQTIDAITDAMREAWQMMPNAKPDALVLKFHPGTQLLLVSAPPEAIGVVESIISKLPSKARINMMPMANPADEARRLDLVAEEVRTRRALRQAATSTGSSANPLDRVEQIIADSEQRRAERTAARPPTAPAKSTETPAEREKRLEEIRAEVERRRASRPAAEKTTPPASPALAPAEPEKK